MKVFWSWQSDTPGKTGRHFVRQALKDAIEELKQSPEIEEPTKRESRDALHLDHDIQGETGSPDLARTIFRKIDDAKVVIADVTLVGVVNKAPDSAATGEKKPKKLINSNVALELGYALRAVSDKNVLLLFNMHYGVHEDLPFDLRHKGGAIVYNLAPDAEKASISAERKELKGQFVKRLKAFLEKGTSHTVPFSPTPSTFSPAAYFENKSEVLGEAGQTHDKVLYAFDTQKLSYIRLIPMRLLQQELSRTTLRKFASTAPLLSRTEGGVAALNKFGAIRIEPTSHPPNGRAGIRNSTQLFTNGELWSISSNVIVQERVERHPDGLPYPYLPSTFFEQMFYDTLHNLLKFADKLVGTDMEWQVELGSCELAGVHIAIRANDFEPFWGPIQSEKVVFARVISGRSSESVDKVLLEFFTRIYDAAGHERPKGLFGFPPLRPGSTRS